MEPENSSIDFKAFQSDFGAYIKRLRKERHWSQDDLAGYTGIAKPYISTIERGLSKPCLDTIQKLAFGFGISVSELFHFQVEENTTSTLKARIKMLLDDMEDTEPIDILTYRIISLLIHK